MGFFSWLFRNSDNSSDESLDQKEYSDEFVKSGEDSQIAQPSLTYRSGASFSSLTEQEKSMVDKGQPIAAIKEVRERTGFGLVEAKALVDAYMHGESVPAVSRLELTSQEKALIDDGQLLRAVKSVRDRTGVHLEPAVKLAKAYEDTTKEL